MATSQMKRSDTKTGTWSSIFNSTEQINEQRSGLFVKKLLAVAISSVTYLRAVFPERCFGDRCLEDLNLKILRDEDAYPGSSQVIQWVKACFDAIERKYLRKIVLGFYLNASDPDTVIETYTFKFDYYSDGINIYRNDEQIASAKTADDTKRSTIRLLRTLVVLTQTLKSLPDDVMMTMKLLYYDDVTPSDYQPPGFEDIEYSRDNFPPDAYRFGVGDISTPFHMVGLRCQSRLHQTVEKPGDYDGMKEDSYLDNEPDTKANIDNNTEQMQKDNVDDSENPYLPGKPEKSTISTLLVRDAAKKKVGDEEMPMECSTVPPQSPNIPGPNEVAGGANTKASTPITLTGEQMVPNSVDVVVECSCGFNGDDGMMILCDICKKWQHAACYRFITEEDCPTSHICVSCAKNNNAECTDSTLVLLNSITIQTTCLWRRALVASRKSTRLTAPKFAERLGVELTVAQGLMKRMQNDGFLRQVSKGKRLGKLVVKEKFTIEALKNYFCPSTELIKKTEKVQKSETKKPDNGKKNSSEKEELQRMVDKAAEIDISGKFNARPEKNKGGEVYDQKSKLRSRKRVISVIDNDLEFTVSDSQDPLDNLDGNPTKKKKASAAQQAILI